MKTKTPNGYFKYILAIDCETTGLCFDNDSPVYNSKTGERHQMVSWAGIIADSETLRPIESLYVEIKWNDESKTQRKNKPSFGKKAEQIHQLTFSHLEKHGIEEEEALIKIGNLILKYFGDNSIRLLGHNVYAFDMPFLKDLFDRYEINIKFGSRLIDTSTIGFICYGTYTSDDLFNLLDIQREKHDALEDAQCSLKIAQITKKLFNNIIE